MDKGERRRRVRNRRTDVRRDRSGTIEYVGGRFGVSHNSIWGGGVLGFGGFSSSIVKAGLSTALDVFWMI